MAKGDVAPPRYFVIQGGPSPDVILDAVEARHGSSVRALMGAGGAPGFVYCAAEIAPHVVARVVELLHTAPLPELLPADVGAVPEALNSCETCAAHDSDDVHNVGE